MQKLLCLAAASLVGGCAFEGDIFPIWEPNFFDTPPTTPGPYAVSEYRVDVPDGADGEPTSITVFAPVDAPTPSPLLIWVTGSNVQAYYHQSLHETLASYGYAVIVSDGRRLTFTDFNYHRRTLDLAAQALDLARDGSLGITVDPQRIAAGGYSIGGTLAAMLAAEVDGISALVFWAPTAAPLWTGVSPDALLPQVTAPAFYLLGELDPIAPPQGWPATLEARMPDSEASIFVIENGTHLFFQQPTGADEPTDPETPLTRFEQQGIAIEQTLGYLDAQFGLE